MYTQEKSHDNILLPYISILWIGYIKIGDCHLFFGIFQTKIPQAELFRIIWDLN